jgi:hypothetical protein
MRNLAPASSNPIAAVDLDPLYYELLEYLSAKPIASTATTDPVRPTSALRRRFDDLATLPDVRRLARPGTFATSYRRKTMKIFIIAAAVLMGISCADARASDNGAETRTDSVGALKRPPLRSSISSGIELHVWTPVAPPYSAEANGDLAARNIWGAG